jgi:hypothetical protein
MDDEVDDMVSGNVRSMKSIVQGKGEKADGPRQRQEVREFTGIPDKAHLRDAAGVIELEGHLKGIGIGKKAQEDDQYAMDQGSVECKSSKEKGPVRAVDRFLWHLRNHLFVL